MGFRMGCAVSGREWKPGDVGITARGSLALRRLNHPDGWIDSHGAPWSNGKFPTNVRPLVVIDPEDRRAVEALRDEFDRQVIVQNDDPDPRDVTPPMRGNAMQTALRSLVTPPKPDEPMDRSARVTAGGMEWASINTSAGLRWITDGGVGITWAQLTTDHPDAEVTP